MDELQVAQWLVSDDAKHWLTEAASMPNDPVKLVSKLRKSLSIEQAAKVAEQLQLRKRATNKFPQAELMFFTPLGMEQSTDYWVAEHKAKRFSDEHQIADLCCGIGGDLISLAEQANKITGIDLNPVTALFARENIKLIENKNLAEATVLSHSAEEFDLHSVDCWHIDPDRRASGNRTTQVEAFQPDLSVLESLLTINPNAAMKLAPATDVPNVWEEEAELEWISRGGECRQQVAWFGKLANQPGKRVASILSKNGTLLSSIVGSKDDDIPFSSTIKRYLYEPDAAILAAKLSGALAQQELLAAFSSGVAYLTADHLTTHPAFAAFEVQQILPFDLKKLKHYLRNHQIGKLEVKKRNVDVEPSSVQSKLKVPGERSATLILCPIQNQVKAIIAQRVEQSQ